MVVEVRAPSSLLTSSSSERFTSCLSNAFSNEYLYPAYVSSGSFCLTYLSLGYRNDSLRLKVYR